MSGSYSLRFVLMMLVAFTSQALTVQVHGQSTTSKKNVLFIAVDDLNTCLGCYGHPVVKSPNIDRLAARGMRFDRAYCQYPLCNPSRTSFLSGRRPDTTRIFDNTTPPRTHLGNVVFLPEYFRQHGYFTARVGKIAHGTFADAVSWDISEEPRGGGRQGGQQARPRQQRRQGTADAAAALWHATDNTDQQEPDGRIARRVVELLEQHKDEPFFIAAGFHKPHIPWVAPQKYFAMYPPDSLRLPEEPADDRADVPALAFNRNANFASITDEASRKKAISAYYACVTFLDAQVGVVLEALDRLQLWDNTVVVFFSDHGFHLGEHGGLWAKMSLFEESARVPLVVVAPGKKANVACSNLVELVDLYPTLTELCGLPTPEGMEGTSFAPLLDDPQRPWKKAAFTQVQRGRNVMGRSIRTERYRYTEWNNEESAELYDHHTDPYEYTNLARDPAHKEVVAELRRLLHEGWTAALPPKSPSPSN